MGFPCRVSMETSAYLEDEARRTLDKEIPDFTDPEVVRQVAGRELSTPIASLLHFRDQFLSTQRAEIKDQLMKDMLIQIAALERGLFARWEQL